MTERDDRLARYLDRLIANSKVHQLIEWPYDYHFYSFFQDKFILARVIGGLRDKWIVTIEGADDDCLQSWFDSYDDAVALFNRVVANPEDIMFIQWEERN